MKGQLPRPEGEQRDDRLRPGDLAPLVGGRHWPKLFSEWDREFVAFHHGLLFLAGGLQVDPVADWYQTYPGEPEVFHVDFDMPIFRNMRYTGRPNIWERRLLFCQLDAWPSLHKYLSLVTIVDRDQQRTATGFWKAIPMTDPGVYSLAVVPEPTPRLITQVLCLDGNTRRIEVEQSPIGLQPAEVRVGPPSSNAQKYGQFVLEGNPQPFNAVDRYRQGHLCYWEQE